MIREGLVGDAVLLPEYLATPLPVAGRGLAIFQATVRRDGEPVHEVLRPPGTPDVVAAGAQLVNRLHTWNEKLRENSHPLVGHDSTFVGNLQAGEIYNQSPTECFVQGTRRWVPPASSTAVQDEFSQVLAGIAAATGTEIDVEFAVQGGAYQIDSECRFVHAVSTGPHSSDGLISSPGRQAIRGRRQHLCLGGWHPRTNPRAGCHRRAYSARSCTH